MNGDWVAPAVNFLRSLSDPSTGGARSVPNGPLTLYGTCYSQLGRYYLGDDRANFDEAKRFVLSCQDEKTGLLIGPELANAPDMLGRYDKEHLLLHLTCTAVAACQTFDVPLQYPIRDAYRFCELNYLSDWLNRRDLKDPWFEGNNILFVGQLLVYLRDVERHTPAQAALELWFEWLDNNIDPTTNVWGTDRGGKVAEAVYGGYHQLLFYYHEDKPIRNPRGLIDTVLGLQHRDGGFNTFGNAGACEDVDSVDILVNLYKRFDYRRAEIRYRLKRCVHHILTSQNVDGGFSYRRRSPFSHMEIPDTYTDADVSSAFPTWFRIHTLALCAEIIPDHPALRDVKFNFSKTLSMGWHASPASWKLEVTLPQMLKTNLLSFRDGFPEQRTTIRRFGGKVLRRIGLR